MRSGIFILVVLFLALVNSLTVLQTPHSVSGIVWNDWNNDGIRQGWEPGFPYVKVSLLYQSSSDMRLVTGEPALVEMKQAFTTSDGKYHFSCLTAGDYAVRFHTPENRPSTISPADMGGDDMIDSDVTSNEGNVTGTTDLFRAEEGGSSYIDLGLWQYVWPNQFPLTSRQSVPPAPATSIGVVYGVYNFLENQLYYRIVREEWKEPNYEVSGAFWVGWKGEDGPLANTISDRANVKENVWFIPNENQYDLKIGKIFIELVATGSFSDKGRIRGQFYNFNNGKYVTTTTTLLGRNVIPTEVTTSSAQAEIQFLYNIDSDTLEYEIEMENFGLAEVESIGIYGPSAKDSIGELILELDPQATEVDVSNYTDFASYFLTDQLYVQIDSSEYPEGHVRGQIQQPLRVIYHSVFNLTSHISEKARGEAVFTLDWRKSDFFYYVYLEGLDGDEVETYLIDMVTGDSLDLDGEMAPRLGNAVKQGYFFNINKQHVQSLLGGHVEVVVQTTSGVEMTGMITNWF